MHASTHGHIAPHCSLGRSARKKYERQFVQKEFLLSDVAREETPQEHGKCMACGYFACQCSKKRQA